MEDIIANIKTNDQTTEEEADKTACRTSNNENIQVMEAVEEGLMQVHGTAPNTKQQGIFRILGETAMALTIGLEATTR